MINGLNSRGHSDLGKKSVSRASKKKYISTKKEKQKKQQAKQKPMGLSGFSSYEKVEQKLRQFGFCKVRATGGHGIWRHKDGLRTTVVPRGTVKKGTLNNILKQAGVSKEAFFGCR